MKIEISLDQNTLTVDGVVYEARPDQDCCTNCAFEIQNEWGDWVCGQPFTENWRRTACISTDRDDNKTIVWSKKEVKKCKI